MAALICFVIAAIAGAISIITFIASFSYTGADSMGGLGSMLILIVTIPITLLFLLFGLLAKASTEE